MRIAARCSADDALSRPLTTTTNWVDGNPLSGSADSDRVQLTRYDSRGRVSATSPGQDRWDVVQYDALSRVTTSITNCVLSGQAVWSGCAAFTPTQAAENQVATTTFDARGRVASTTSPRGVVNQPVYDGLDRTIQTIRNPVPNGPATATSNITRTTTYNGLGQVIATTDPTGATVQRAYDALGRTVVLTDAVGRVTRMGYDADGLRWTRTPDGRFIVQTTDALGRVVARTVNYQDGVADSSDPTDRDLISTTTYDAGGRTVATTAPDGRTTRFGYDLLDRLINVTENAHDSGCPSAPCNVVTTYTTDRVGNQTAITDANGHTRTFAFDGLDRMVSTTDALSRTTTWSYAADEHSMVTQDGRGSGMARTATFDRLGQVISITAPGWTSAIATTYTVDGQPHTQTTTDGGTTSWAYDGLGRTTAITDPLSQVVQYGYDARSQRTSLTYPDSTVVQYGYHADGHLATVQQGGNAIATYSYDPAGRLATVVRGSGLTSSYGYDGADRPTQMGYGNDSCKNGPFAGFAHASAVASCCFVQRSDARECAISGKEPDHCLMQTPPTLRRDSRQIWNSLAN